MTRLFILGSGFSKALSQQMPTVRDLAEYVNAKIDQLPGDHQIYRRLVSDPELLLTYLFQAMPWKREADYHIDKAAFLILSKHIAEYIASRENSAFEQSIPTWGCRFVEFLNRDYPTVATLNYDTVLERLSRNHHIATKPGADTFSTGNLYRIPLVYLPMRTNELTGLSRHRAFTLLKLHGSTNWYYSGDENVAGQQVYYSEVGEKDQRSENDKLDLVPLLIPPVAEKSFFYHTNMLKTLWRLFQQAIQEADEIFSVGYSIPKTDLTMRLFLSAFASHNGKIIYVVNSANGKDADDLMENYKQVFVGCILDDRYLGKPSAVREMVVDLLDSEPRALQSDGV